MLLPMLQFSSPEFEREFRSALSSLGETVEVRIDSEEVWPEPCEDEPEVIVSPETMLGVSPPRAEFEGAMLAGDLAAFAREVTSDTVSFDGLVYHSTVRSVVRVNAADLRTYMFIEGLKNNEPEMMVVPLPQELGTGRVGLTLHSIHFGVSIVRHGFHWDKDQPALSEGDLFVTIAHNGEVTAEVALDIVHAYLFELNSAHDLVLGLLRQPTAEDATGDDHESPDEPDTLAPRVRPLMYGSGMGPLLREFHRGVMADDSETAVVSFAKCIEYVSATVVRLKQYDDLRRRLEDRGALRPTAVYMDGLMALCEENRVFLKDKAALKLTVERCCDAASLAPLAPDCLVAMKLRQKSAPVTLALSSLAACLTATRNQLAHSKANYQSTGEECPSDQLDQLGECARRAAEQCIRWYAAQNPDLRR